MIFEDFYAWFDISLLGSKTKQSYIGTFKVHCLMSPMAYIKADKLYRQLLGENSLFASEKARNLAFAYSQLQQRIVEAPPFWVNRELGGSHIMDDNIILEVLNQAILAEEKFLEQKNEEIEPLKSYVEEQLEDLQDQAMEESSAKK